MYDTRIIFHIYKSEKSGGWVGMAGGGGNIARGGDGILPSSFASRFSDALERDRPTSIMTD